MNNHASRHRCVQNLLTIFSILALSSLILVPKNPALAAQQVDATLEEATPSVFTLTTTEVNHGMSFSWSLPAGEKRVQAAALDQMMAEMDSVRIDDYELPMQLHTVLLPEHSPEVQLHQVESSPWRSILPAAKVEQPTAIGWEEDPLPYVGAAAHMPDQPLFILRQGMVRGQRIGVVALSPIYSEKGETKLALQLDGFIPGAQPFSGDISELMTAQPTNLSQRLSDTLAIANVAARKDAIKIHVKNPGIQEISGTNLIAGGFAEGSVLANMHLWRANEQLKIQVIDGDGILDAETIIRFYASASPMSASVGDFWNDSEVYWITQENLAGLRMSVKSANPGGATVRSTAFQEGVWENNVIYESTMPGVDGDYWFAYDMRATPSEPSEEELIPLNHTLPIDANSPRNSRLSFSLTARTVATHTLQVTIGSSVRQLTWRNSQFYEAWEGTLEEANHASTLKIELLPGQQVGGADTLPSEIRFDKVEWRKPVQLDFNNQGATFTGVDGTWRYQISNTPAGRALYDITDPDSPQLMAIPSGASVQFQDGPTARQYLLTGPGTLHTPTTSAHKGVLFATDFGVDALYIAPQEFHDELAPLIAHRQSQGYRVHVVDVQHIYDTWSFGSVSPVAIRDLLRFAVANWNPAPIAFTIVGDSTSDPLNRLGNLSGTMNANIVPAYMARVDPWIGHTVCQNCLAQLDGADPLASAEDPAFLIDIWPGRLSVQNEEQLKTVVEKILQYETASDLDLGVTWRQTAMYVADDFMRLDGSIDPAGNFALFIDNIIQNWQTPNLKTQRIYYDERPGGPEAGPGRYTDADVARQTVIDTFRNGAGLVSYNGHSNHFQWAVTDFDKYGDDAFLFGFNDILTLNNQERLSILLEMTCYTAQFTRVSRTGTTMDERFQRHENGGAVAIWGPAGLTVAHGHDTMLQGFHDWLWSQPRYTARMGGLIEAGYFRLYSKGGCCQDARKTFLLLGDPLTPALVQAPTNIHLPQANR